MKILFLHHYYIPKKAFGCTYLTNFHEEFDNADHIGVDAILETYDRLYNEWKDNSVYIMELMLVLNHRVAFWAKQHRKEQMNKKYLEYELLYLDLCVKTRKYRRRKFYSETRKNWQIIE